MEEEADGNRPLAYRERSGAKPTVIFMPGYMSDMAGTKALALDVWAHDRGQAFVRFDYGGTGESGGEFEAQTLGDWRDDVLAIIDLIVEGPVVLVGSSMGGWLMLHVALARPERVAGLVGIAAAPDFTSWAYSQEQKMTILQSGKLELPSPYGDQPLVITRKLWESGEALRLLHAPIDIDSPVRLLHGQLDTDVPWAYSLELMKLIRSADVQTLLVKHGDHRLSRDTDIAAIVRATGDVLSRL